MSALPAVTVAVPVLNEALHIEACLDAIAAQTYSNIAEVLVIDGGSTDRTRELAVRLGATVLDNPRRIQAAALNVALLEAKGEVLVRVDGHCELAADYVERCVEALERTGAAVVGGAMTPTASGWKQRGIAAAMSSPLGAGPARFHVGGDPGWVDTVYLGAYRTDDARAVGGYAEDVGVNEDAEFAIRMARSAGVWFDPNIRSTYVPRDSFRALARQFYRYGRSRAATVRKHPRSLSPRQLVAPALVLGLTSRYRRPIALAYSVVVVAGALAASPREDTAPSGFAVALPIMHLCWGAGFLVETVRGCLPPRAR
ncbi:MAG: hypothetical protein QOC92_4627 [Acidimicrobiaceae bacterium]